MLNAKPREIRLQPLGRAALFRIGTKGHDLMRLSISAKIEFLSYDLSAGGVMGNGQETISARRGGDQKRRF